MGIQGLLTFVKPASKNVHLSDLKGKTVAIDSYCWIHKGAFGCAEKLGKGEDTDAYVQYCFKFLDMLRSFKITPIMVFDGLNLPAKRLTEEKRREGRALARKKAAECLKLNKQGEARMNFIKAVDVTPEMALKLIKACRKQNIDCIVAPYEADAQLAFLNQNGIVDFVITEDSDLLVFGCSKVLFKLDLNGNGTLVESDKLFLTMDEKPDSFTIDKFRHMCILSGCDYLESLPGVGLKKGMKFIKANSNTDIYEALPKLPSTLNLKNVTVTKEYRDNFMTADATFRHQLIYDPLKREIKPLFDPKELGTKIEYCSNAGDMMEQKTAFQLAIGNLSPDDLKVMDNWNPDKDLSPYAFKPSIWSKSYKKPDKFSRNELGNDIDILPKTKNKNVIIDIKIPLLPTENELRQNAEREILREENIVKEIHALYFEENPTKKICLEKTEKTNTETKVSPILTRNRKNIFIKSRFFSEKTQKGTQGTNEKNSNQNETTIIFEKTQKNCSITQNIQEDPSTNEKNLETERKHFNEYLKSFESHRTELTEKILSVNETQGARFNLKRKLGALESPEKKLNNVLIDNDSLKMPCNTSNQFNEPLNSIESHRNDINDGLTSLNESRSTRFSFKKKLGSLESPEKKLNDLLIDNDSLKMPCNTSNQFNEPLNSIESHRNDINDGLTSLNESRSTRFSFKKKLGSLRSPEKNLNYDLIDEDSKMCSNAKQFHGPLKSGESHRNEINNELKSLTEAKDTRFSCKSKFGSLESPEKNLIDKIPLKLLSPDSSVKNSADNLVNDDFNDEEVSTSLSQKENAEKIFRSRFFSENEIDEVEIKKSEKVLTFEKNEKCQSTQVSQGGNYFSRSKSLDEKLFHLSNQKSTVSAKTTSCRRIGLSKKSSGSKFTVQKNQTKLSMFFKKT